jgi:hypothetical protein
MWTVGLVLAWAACGGKDDEYTPDTSPATTDPDACWVTDQGGVALVEHDNIEDCARCPGDWECATYENFVQTKCFMPCRDQEDCDKCASGTSCVADKIGPDLDEVRICK